MIHSSQSLPKTLPWFAWQKLFFIFGHLKWKMQSLGIIYELHETSEYFMHQIFGINSSKLLVAEHTFFMAADFRSVTLPSINSSIDASR